MNSETYVADTNDWTAISERQAISIGKFGVRRISSRRTLRRDAECGLSSN